MADLKNTFKYTYFRIVLYEQYREFLYTLCSDSPIINILHYYSIFVTIKEPVFIETLLVTI